LRHAVTHTTILPVRTPYRLDLTVEALRRLSENIVDVVTRDGRYLRALHTSDRIAVVEVRQVNAEEIEVRCTGTTSPELISTVQHMLGTEADLRAWYARVRAIPWLAQLAKRLHGVKPPCYPDLWEAICHGIVFQQLSIGAAGSIMKRLVAAVATPVAHDGVTLYPFPRPRALLEAREATLRAAGLSARKAEYLRSAARAALDGTLDVRHIERLPTLEAALELSKLRGIGPWSAAVVLLRGLGRLDTFPLKDSGVARSLKKLSGDPQVDLDAVLAGLGDVRGMLYFYLLLGNKPSGTGF
jgi:DNA-3-methyladenine glycosylase II